MKRSYTFINTFLFVFKYILSLKHKKREDLTPPSMCDSMRMKSGKSHAIKERN